MMTLANKFVTTKSKDYASFQEFVKLVDSIDPAATLTMGMQWPVIEFSDGSKYELGATRAVQ